MSPAFGPLVAVLGAVCAGNALAAAALANYPLRTTWAVDGGLKIVIGALMWSVPWMGSHVIPAV